jgi:hypothetical protein
MKGATCFYPVCCAILRDRTVRMKVMKSLKFLFSPQNGSHFNDLFYIIVQIICSYDLTWNNFPAVSTFHVDGTCVCPYSRERVNDSYYKSADMPSIPIIWSFHKTMEPVSNSYSNLLTFRQFVVQSADVSAVLLQICWRFIISYSNLLTFQQFVIQFCRRFSN